MRVATPSLLPGALVCALAAHAAPACAPPGASPVVPPAQVGEGEGEGEGGGGGEGEGEGGSEGEGEGAGESLVRINEVSCAAEDWIELTTSGDSSIDVSGFILTDRADDPTHRLTLPEGATVGPGAFVVVDVATFGLSCASDVVLLLDRAGNPADEADLFDVPAGLTIGRLPDATGAFTVNTPTRGAPNEAPLLGATGLVLNEVDCRGREWIELFNASSAALDVAGFVLSDGSAADYTLPAQVIEPGAFLLVQEQQLDADGITVIEDGLAFHIACGIDPVSLRDASGALVDFLPPSADVPLGATTGRLPDGSGAFLPTLPTKAAPNQAFASATASLFDPTRVVTIDLFLEQGALDALNADLYSYVNARFTLTDESGTSTPIDVGVRVKGRVGSARDLSGKPAFKVDFNRFVPGQRFRGLKKLALNNMVQDPTFIHEHLAYSIFRSMGVPASNLGYAAVRLNGVDYGLYANVETVDDVFLATRFASTRHLYEGGYGEDIEAGLYEAMDVDEGDPAERSDIDALVAAVANAPAQGFMDALAPRVAWDDVLLLMATEVFIGHWDGYAPTRNNYYLHFDETERVVLLPWGLDQTFVEPIGLYEGYGTLFSRCLADVSCRSRYDEALLAVAEQVAASDYAADLAALSSVIFPFIEADPRKEFPAEEHLAGIPAALDFLARRGDAVRSLLACGAADIDGDGATCAADCLEGDSSVYPGAPEVCNDSIDQDCNGRPDDSASCGPCTEAALATGSYLFCFEGLDFFAAAELCAAQGARLAVLETSEEDVAVFAEAAARLGTAYWIGLSDTDVEGQFLWVNDTPLEFSSFAEGEPNDADGAEDCVHVIGGEPQWNDVSCDTPIPSVCER